MEGCAGAGCVEESAVRGACEEEGVGVGEEQDDLEVGGHQHLSGQPEYED